MKKKTYIALISALTISGAFLLNWMQLRTPGTEPQSAQVPNSPRKKKS